ncbi:lactonase family protein [Jatrophihabitans cynanchi]|uniref:Lactonase family protein n=1 Tax=Jatrophihabitans cynanchi TaxID=2944128 RepID=A0ABY7K0W1_9ACTN|nr:beta-propeller fold lactonase family protein [Jatrophihabitans sp. SB3-54]WAX58452.1 lactonase family protein [Jatrophihabitans sp. SB3-54]
MTTWQVYAGTFTKHFVQEVERLRADSNVWWANKGADVGAPRPSPFIDGKRYPAGGELADGLEVFEFDDQTGALAFQQAYTSDIANPQYVALHPKLPLLYASQMARPSRLSAFDITDGALDWRFAVDTGADLAIAVSVHPSGRLAYVAHYSDGTLTALHLDDDGRVTHAEPVVRGQVATGSKRFSRHHESHFTVSGNALLVTDIGLEELTVYRTAADGVFTDDPPAHIAFPERSAPRHMACHPSGRYVYVVGEADSRLYVVAADDGVPTHLLGSYLTRPESYAGDNKTSDIKLHPNGRFLYVGNRGSDCVTTCLLDDGGGVQIAGFHPALGKGPSALAVDPSGRFLLVGNTYSGNLAMLSIGVDGELDTAAAPISARAPRCLVFGERSE